MKCREGVGSWDGSDKLQAHKCDRLPWEDYKNNQSMFSVITFHYEVPWEGPCWRRLALVISFLSLTNIPVKGPILCKIALYQCFFNYNMCV